MLYENHVVEKLTPAQAYFIACDKKYMWFCAGRGCFLRDTEIKMFDGTAKFVQDIVEGDMVLGTDRMPRHVMSTVTGREEAYRVLLEDGSYYDCNLNHNCLVVENATQLVVSKSVKEMIGETYLYSQIRNIDGKLEKQSFDLLYLGIEPYYGFTTDGNNQIQLNNGIFSMQSGKCFGIDTKFVMYDGSIKKVQDLTEGDVMMGWDNTPRRILSTCRGVDNLYEVKPKKKNQPSHIVNEAHNLVLRNPEIDNGKPFDIELLDFLHQKKTHKNKQSRLFRVAADFPEKPVGIDPYILGLWLGDGTKDRVEITNQDQQVIDVWDAYMSQFDFLTRSFIDQGNNTLRIKYSAGRKLRDKNGWSYNPVYSEFKKCLVNDEKRIPEEFLTNSREVRLKLIAGLIDTDGYLNANGNYDFVTKYIGLKDDFVRICRSVGLCANWSEKKIKIREGDVRSYWRVCVSGDLSMVPCKITRKQAPPRRKKYDGLSLDFSIIPLGKGDYYGFTVEGDGRVLLDDFTVTRNTTVGSYWVYKNVIKYPRSSGIIAANSYAQLHGATIPPILAYFRQIGLDFRINKRPPESWLKRSPLVIAEYKGVLTFETGAHVFLRSLDNYDLMRGLSVGWIWIDEIASTSKEAWDVTVGCLRDKNCDERHVRVTGTPDGPQWTWEEFKKKWSDDPLEAAQYDIVFMSARENPFLPPDFLDGMLSAYDRRKALQEIDGRILADQASSTYYEYRPDYHKRLVMPYDPNKPLILCWDFNATKESPLSMEVCQRHEYSDGTPFVQVIDEFIMPGGNTPAVCEMFLAKYKPLHKSKVYVYGDRTGNTSTTGTTDYQQVKERIGAVFELENRVSRSNMAIKQRVGSVNGMLLNTKGQVRLFISPVCVELLKDLEKVQPGKFDIIDKSDPARTHASDALGYFIGKEFPVVLRSDVRIKNINVSNIGYR